MPIGDRFLVDEVVQLGMESTPGTPVPPTVRLSGLNVELDTELEVDVFGPAGNIFNTISAPRQEWASGSLSGFPTYTELPYVFSNIFGAATITTPSGSTDTRRWVWQPSSSDPWTPITWTIRKGVLDNSAEQASYGLMTGVGLSFSRTAAPEISGDLIARALDYAASLAASGVVQADLVPILPSEVCVYLDPTAAAIGTTRLTRDFLASFDIADLFGPIWTLDCTVDSFAGHTRLKPTTTATLQLGNDGQGREPVTIMRNGDSRFLRIEATGPVIDTGPPELHHRLRIDAALKVTDAPSRSDSDGLSTLEWTFGLFDDPDFGSALTITVDTTLATL